MRIAYESLSVELKDLSDAKKNSKDGETNSDQELTDHIYSELHDLLRHLCGQLLVFTKVRLKMIELYPFPIECC